MYKLHLILKYLRKRRIAWVSLVAVMLCTAMVLVVISVMGGWLRMFRQSFKGLNGDVVVQADGLRGFPYYDQILDRVRKLPAAAAATPVLHTFALLKIGSDWGPYGVQVIGYKIDQIGEVNHFPESLHRQTHGTPSFKPFLPASEYKDAVADSRINPLVYPGMIVGDGVVGIQKNEKGQIIGRTSLMYTTPATLTVMDLSAGGPITQADAKYRTYWIVDDSRTKVYQVDENTVYVPFDVLQKDLGLAAHTVTMAGRQVTIPARTSEIDIRAKNQADVQKLASDVQQIVNQVYAQNSNAFDLPDVYTWDQQPGTKSFLEAVQNEMVLVTFLFSLISVVAVFLIFCIFYMIVAEKTRDIGIIKSVGASSGGVAQIFLGYGLAIGIVGGLAGLLLGYGIVHNINFLHGELSRRLGITIWRPDVYAFDTIPNTVNAIQATIIVAVAIVSSVLGSLIPAWHAAKMNPVEALRWE
ncbi:MAG TPA: FtsX-like permease family protein [Tepidisphaeraceae bacterium]|nr:FtsX-like permease family protein [Tepidisphaeraceae bacterium]